MHLRLICLLLTAFALAPAARASITAQIQPSRTDCIAPCYVHFDGFSATVDSTRTKSDAFNDLHYVWSLEGANPTARWPFSNKPKSAEHSPIAATVFEQPGTYRVILDVHGGQGNSS